MEYTAHAGHSHSFLGEVMEKIISPIPMGEELRECIVHILTDSVSVFALLISVMLIVFLATGYINLGKLQTKLSSLRSVGGFSLAIMLGILSPFCSCSIIPVLMGFLSVGVPMSVCLCFLTASSMINITAILSLYATMGPSFTLWYIAIALVIIIVSSIIFALLKLENGISKYHSHEHHDQPAPQTFKQRISAAWDCTINVLKRSAPFIIIGVVLSSVIMVYLPIDELSKMVGENSIASTLFAVLIGIPIHSEVFSIAPLLHLFNEISRQLALVFAISTMAISLPSIIILCRVIKPKTVLIYCGTIISLTTLICIFL